LRSSISDIIYLVALFSVTIPIITGLFYYKKFTPPLKSVFYFLLFSFFYEAIESFIKAPNIYNLYKYLFFLILTLVYFSCFLHWAGTKKREKYIIFAFIIYLITVVIEILIIGLNTYKILLVQLVYPFLLSLFAIILINKTYSSKVSIQEKKVRLLILIPFFIFYIYFSLISIFMFFLYNPSTQKLFSNLYWVIRILNPINYLCVSLAFYLHPRQEVYLK
jgi:hypothetical protein